MVLHVSDVEGDGVVVADVRLCDDVNYAAILNELCLSDHYHY